MLDDEGFILKEVWGVKRIKIPEGYIKCPECHGTGNQVKIYRDPGPNEYMMCFECMGKGYIRKRQIVKNPWPSIVADTLPDLQKAMEESKRKSYNENSPVPNKKVNHE